RTGRGLDSEASPRTDAFYGGARKLRIAASLFCCAVFLVVVSTGAADNPGTSPGAGAATILVKFRPGTGTDAQADVHRRHGGVVVDEIKQLGIKVVRVPPGEAAQAVSRAYAGENGVAYAEPNA